MPALEGRYDFRTAEPRLQATVGGGRDLPVRSRRYGPGVHRRHAASHGLWAHPHRPRVLLHAGRRDDPLPPHAGRARPVPLRLRRQRAADGALHGAGHAASRPRRSGAARSSRPASNCRSRWRRNSSASGSGLGCRVDWRLKYSTIDPRSRRISQFGFIDLFEKQQVYRSEEPTLWCPECQTGVAQAEIDDKVGVKTQFTTIPFVADGRTGAAHRHHAPRAAGGVRGGHGQPRRQALRRLRRPDGAHADLRSRGAGHRRRQGRQGQGHRRGHVLHLRRRHRRVLVAHPRAAAAHRGDPRRAAQRAGGPICGHAHQSRADKDPGRPGRSGPGARPARDRAHRRRARALPDRDRVPGYLAVVRESPREQTALSGRGPPHALVPRVHARSLRELDRGPELGLESVPPALLRRAVPGLVLHRVPRADHGPPRGPAHRPARGRSAARGVSWLRRNGVRTGHGRHGHLGNVVVDAGDLRHAPGAARRVGRRVRRPLSTDDAAPQRARHHPHLGLLHHGAKSVSAWRHSVERRA